MSGPRKVIKKVALSVTVTVLFFAALEGVLALSGVEPEPFERDPYVGFSSTSRLFVEVAGAGGVPELVTAENKLTLFNEQRFSADKGDTFRIFCVGGSTTFGRPYDDATSFCGWLRELLPVADPSRRWEVVNAGGVSYASYRVAILMEELIGYDPDLFIIYSGHNEFLERRSYPQIIAMPRALRGVGAVAAKTRTWVAMSRGIGRLTGKRRAVESAPDVLGSEVKTLLDGAVGPKAYTRNDELAGQILRHYRFNLTRMIDIARSAGAGAMLVTPAANLGTSRPFKSEHRDGLSDDETERFQSALDGAGRAHAEGRLGDSLDLVAAAAAIDPRHAQLAFLQGRLLAEAGRWDEAKAAFERARDEDICPLRAIGPMAGIVREVAAERGAAVVDFESLAGDRAEHGIPGSDLFLDHVHPTIEGNRLLALQIIEEMERDGIVRPTAGWGDASVAEVVGRVEGSIDSESHALALMKLAKVLGWAGKLHESYRLAAQAVELFPDNSMIQYTAGLTAHLVGRKDQAVAHYRRAVELQPDADEAQGNLGVLLEEAGLLDEAIHHFRMAIRFARTPETATRNSENLAHALMVSGHREYGAGRLPESLAHLTEAAGLAPREPEILGRLGIAQLAAGRFGEAVASFATALAARPNDPILTNRLALALALDGQLDRAAETYRRALSLDPKVADLPDNLFKVLQTMGRRDLLTGLQERLAG